MPALSVSVDGEELATVATDGLSMIALRLSASRWDEVAATLDMSGGDYRAEGGSPHRIWIDSRPLQGGQVVKVSSVAATPTHPAGKTIAELYPDSESCTQTDFTPSAAMLDEISGRPLLRGGYTFRLSTSTGMEYTGHTRDDEYGFSFSVMWTAQYRPECARFAIRSNSVEQLRARSPGRDHVGGDLWLGQSLRFEFTPSD